MSHLASKKEWMILKQHAEKLSSNAYSSEKESPLFSLSTNAVSIDCFYQQATLQTQQYLIALAKAMSLSQRIEDLFQGKSINVSENRAALHTALREINNFRPEVRDCLEKMQQISEKLRRKEWLGSTGKPIDNILHIGIGGSDLSQRLTVHALKNYADANLDIHFAANIDPEEMDNILEKLNPETTLIIVASKSFSTKETQMNLQKAIDWLGNDEAVLFQVIAITACPEKILAKHKLLPEHMLPIWDWVGGRYSIWSAMGLILMIAIGYENFLNFLKGAHEMDVHFRTTSFEKNIPVMLGLMGIWSINFFHCQTHAVIPYSHRLTYFLQHLQQLEMESNGKSTTALGEKIDYATGAILWGGVGCNSQHSFHQLLHQGTHLTPVDFITIQNDEQDPRIHLLKANCKAQIQALLKNGRSFIHLITLDGLTPYTLGVLMAMYEHKVFVQSQIWKINPFDQPGVELGKILAQEML
jgi:glucose-6-phosphate isomerase